MSEKNHYDNMHPSSSPQETKKEKKEDDKGPTHGNLMDLFTQSEKERFLEHQKKVERAERAQPDRTPYDDIGAKSPKSREKIIQALNKDPSSNSSSSSLSCASDGSEFEKSSTRLFTFPLTEKSPRTVSSESDVSVHSNHHSFLTSQLSKIKLDDKENDVDSVFIGVRTKEKAASKVEMNSFVLYYQLPDSGEEVPAEISLHLAYKNGEGKTSHFAVTSHRIGETMWWQVQYAASSPQMFRSLGELVQFYRIYSYVDPDTGRVETFPVWKKVVIG